MASEHLLVAKDQYERLMQRLKDGEHNKKSEAVSTEDKAVQTDPGENTSTAETSVLHTRKTALSREDIMAKLRPPGRREGPYPKKGHRPKWQTLGY